MTILNNVLYKVVSYETNDAATIYHVALDKDCFIYRAHFPNNPITPGVCMVETALELLEDLTGRQLEISEAKNIKFLHILSPIETPEVDFVFTKIDNNEDSVKAKVNVIKDNKTFAQLSFTAQGI
jgi:3-hydroxyacyl-[acyl-carrier-protein] dehydratase